MISPSNPRSKNLEIQLFEANARSKASRQNISDNFCRKANPYYAKLKRTTNLALNRQGIRLKSVQNLLNYFNINEEFNKDS